MCLIGDTLFTDVEICHLLGDGKIVFRVLVERHSRFGLSDGIAPQALVLFDLLPGVDPVMIT